MTIGRKLRLGLVAAALAGWAAFEAAAPTQAADRIQDLKPIPLQPGANFISRFTSDGRDAVVAQGWRENGNAHGHTVTLVLLSAGSGRFDVVPVERPGTEGGLADIIVDEPHTGEDAVRSVRLARGKVDGSPAVLLVSATREVDLAKGAIPDPAPVRYDVFRLVHQSAEAGSSRDVFRLIQTTRSAGRFCSAEVALQTAWRLPPPNGQKGPQSKDGC